MMKLSVRPLSRMVQGTGLRCASLGTACRYSIGLSMISDVAWPASGTRVNADELALACDGRTAPPTTGKGLGKPSG